MYYLVCYGRGANVRFGPFETEDDAELAFQLLGAGFAACEIVEADS